jgi:polysaccharide pyruvyl transferase WcaK-like protein
MIVEIRNAGFVNKGAELMLLAIVQKIREKYPDARITMAPFTGGSIDTFERMGALRLYPKVSLWRYGFDFGRLGFLIPKRMRGLHGLVLTNEIDVVLDAAGFAYSDQWGMAASRELSQASSIWKRNGTKLVMLPQAFGPYKKNRISKYVKKWATNADLIFAREQDSYNHLIEIVGEQEKIMRFPDFTNLIKGSLPPNYDGADKRIALVPNYRMIDKTVKSESEAYPRFLIRTAQSLLERGLKPFLLVHEGEKDRMLAEKVSNAVGGISIVRESNPLHIKGIIGSCDATIGSRFHGLVSALSQGVPSLATGWSHKYYRLFEDYDFLDGLVSVNDSQLELNRKLDLILNVESAHKIRRNLANAAGKLSERSEEMWGIVFDFIDRTVREP